MKGPSFGLSVDCWMFLANHGALSESRTMMWSILFQARLRFLRIAELEVIRVDCPVVLPWVVRGTNNALLRAEVCRKTKRTTVVERRALEKKSSGHPVRDNLSDHIRSQVLADCLAVRHIVSVAPTVAPWTSL